MLRKNQSQQSLIKHSARVSHTRKLPSDFFVPLDSPKIMPFNRIRKLKPINNQNLQPNNLLEDTGNIVNEFLQQRKTSFEFTFYHSPNNQQHISCQSKCQKQKSSKRQILQKFNIKLPYIKTADSGLQRRKKLYKVRKLANFPKDLAENQSLMLPFRQKTMM